MNFNEKILISFDLDFTLINNKEGILNSFDYAFEEFGIPYVEHSNIEKMIGIPLEDIFNQFTDINSKKLITSFRNYYGKKGIYQVELYPNVINILRKLKDQKIKLGIVTSKKKEMAVKLLKYLKIYEYFDFVIGETKEIKSKTDLKIKKIFYEGFFDYKFIVVGDHLRDRKLAEMLNCPFIGVLTGNHSSVELTERSSIPVLILDNISQLSLEKVHSLIN